MASVETTVKYEGYLKQEACAPSAAKQERAPPNSGEFPFARVPGLSREVVQRLTQVRPETLGQASRIPGITPAAVAVLGVSRSSAESLLGRRDQSRVSGPAGAAGRRAGVSIRRSSAQLEAYYRLLADLEPEDQPHRPGPG